jgi:hypothetical protein
MRSFRIERLIGRHSSIKKMLWASFSGLSKNLVGTVVRHPQEKPTEILVGDINVHSHWRSR